MLLALASAYRGCIARTEPVSSAAADAKIFANMRSSLATQSMVAMPNTLWRPRHSFIPYLKALVISMRRRFCAPALLVFGLCAWRICKRGIRLAFMDLELPGTSAFRLLAIGESK